MSCDCFPLRHRWEAQTFLIFRAILGEKLYLERNFTIFFDSSALRSSAASSLCQYSGQFFFSPIDPIWRPLSYTREFYSVDIRTIKIFPTNLQHQPWKPPNDFFSSNFFSLKSKSRYIFSLPIPEALKSIIVADEYFIRTHIKISNSVECNMISLAKDAMTCKYMPE